MKNDFKNMVFDIVVLAGQSNAEGCGVSLDSKPLVIPDADVGQLDLFSFV